METKMKNLLYTKIYILKSHDEPVKYGQNSF